MATAVRALFCSGGTGVFFLGSWREVAGMTVRKRTILVVVCRFGALRYMFFITCPAGDWSLWEPTPVGDCLSCAFEGVCHAHRPRGGLLQNPSQACHLALDERSIFAWVNWGQIPI
jgi:hypothetical protein